MSAVLAPPAELVDGLHRGLDEGVYRRLNRISYSGAKVLLRSAAHYLVDRQTPKAPTDEQRLGTAFHAELLEPGRLDSMVIEVPDSAPKRPTSVQLNAAKPSPATVSAIEWWRDFDATAGARLQIEPADAGRLKAMLAAVRDHAGAMRLLATGHPEVSLLWHDGRYEVPCKARMDWHRPDGVIVDVKTTVDASPEGFARQCASLSYHMQVAAYFSGCEHVLNETPAAWAWIAVEKEPPFGVATYTAQPDAVLAGMRLWDTALGRYRDAIDSGTWPCYPQTIEPLPFPQWALRVRNT